MRFWRAFLAGPVGAVVAVLAALVLGALVVAGSGHDPIAAFAALVRGAFGGRHLGHLAATLNRAVPIVGMGLGAAIAFRAGMFNLGGEGQLVLGALGAAVCAIYLPLPGLLLAPASLAVGTLVGGAYALVAGRLQFRYRVPLLLSSLLLSYPARYLASYLVNHPLRDRSSGLAQTFAIPAVAELPSLGSRLQRLHVGLPLVLGLVVAAWWLLRSTPGGYELRMSGLNARFADYGGIRLRRVGLRALFLSGGLAGLVGGIQVLAVHRRFIDGALTQPLYAWLGVMTALLVRSRPLQVLVAGLFFAALQTGAAGMERDTEVPREISLVIQGLVLLFVAAAIRSDDGEERS